MRITILSFSILLTIGLLSVGAANVKAQSLNQRVSVKINSGNLYDAIKKIEQTTGVGFAYDADYLNLKQQTVKSANFSDEPLENVLSALLQGSDIVFKESSGNVILTKKLQPGKLYGKVTDESGATLPGANIRVAGTAMGATADANGNYSLIIPEGTYTIQATFVGYKMIEVKDIVIVPDKPRQLNISFTGTSMLSEVTVSYGKQRNREVTGAVSQVKMAPLQDMPVLQFGQ